MRDRQHAQALIAKEKEENARQIAAKKEAREEKKQRKARLRRGQEAKEGEGGGETLEEEEEEDQDDDPTGGGGGGRNAEKILLLAEYEREEQVASGMEAPEGALELLPQSTLLRTTERLLREVEGQPAAVRAAQQQKVVRLIRQEDQPYRATAQRLRPADDLEEVKYTRDDFAVPRRLQTLVHSQPPGSAFAQLHSLSLLSPRIPFLTLSLPLSLPWFLYLSSRLFAASLTFLSPPLSPPPPSLSFPVLPLQLIEHAGHSCVMMKPRRSIDTRDIGAFKSDVTELRATLWLKLEGLALYDHPTFCREDKLYADLRLLHGTKMNTSTASTPLFHSLFFSHLPAPFLSLLPTYSPSPPPPPPPLSLSLSFPSLSFLSLCSLSHSHLSFPPISCLTFGGRR